MLSSSETRVRSPCARCGATRTGGLADRMDGWMDGWMARDGRSGVRRARRHSEIDRRARTIRAPAMRRASTMRRALSSLGARRALATARDDGVVLRCALRVDGGTASSTRARREGRVPGVVFAPGSERGTMITVCEREMNAAVRKHTLAGVACEVFDLEVPTTTATGEESGETRRVRALAKQVQMHAYNQMVDNVCFLEVKPETEVKVRVPVATQGEDVSPGVKRGGFVQIMRQTVPVRCRSDSIPKRFLMDVSTLDAGKVIKIGDVTVPEGVKLLDADLNLPLVRIGGRVKSAE